MSSAHDGHKPSSSSPLGGSCSPFRTFFFQRSSALSPKLQALLRSFDLTLEERFKALTPNDNSSSPEVLTLFWMTSAVESLSSTHVDVKSLITDLEFRWDVDHWMLDMYLDNTVKLLDMCITITSELSRLDQGQLFLQYALLDPPDGLERSLRGWATHVGSTRSPKLAHSLPMLQDLVGSLHQPPPSSSKLKSSSAKGKVLMQAMYGVKVQTIFVCGVLAAALSGSEATLLDLQVPDRFLWSQAFRHLRTAVYAEIRRTSAASRKTMPVLPLLREFQAVDVSTEKLLTVIATADNNPPCGTEASRNEHFLQLRDDTERLSVGMDKLSKQVSTFFQIVLTGRDALLCNLRMPVV